MASFDAHTGAFLEWFKALPGATFSDSIKIADLRSQNAGRGIIATADIEPETTLFTIPRQGIINTQTSELPAKLPSVFDLDAVPADGNEDAPQQDSWSSLILVMIYEFLRGEDSAWKPYFDVLPESFDTPMFWSEEELDELQASAVRRKVGKDDAETMFRTNILPVIRSHPELFTSSESLSDENLISLAHRMGSTIMAYAFDLENDEDKDEDESDGWVEDRDGKSMMGMVPMADILNADAEFNAHINHGDDSLTATALRPIKAGEEIFNYYGPHPNSELLRRYGYVTDRHARYDVVEIPWDTVESALKEELSLSDEQMKQVYERIDEEDLEDTFVMERDAGEPNSDGTFAGPATLTEVSGELQDQLKGFLKAIKKTVPEAIPEKRKRDDVSNTILARTIVFLQSQYGTSIAEDLRAIERSDLTRRQRMAIEVRLGEKKLLEEATALLQSQSNHNGSEGSADNNKRMRNSG